MTIEEISTPSATVLRISGRIDSATANDFDQVAPHRASTEGSLVIDLAEVDYVSSAGLRVFLRSAKAARSSGCRLVLTGLTSPVREVFDISGFATLFAITADRESAIASLG